MAQGRVVKRSRDKNGNPIGRANDNPILDTHEYNVEFEDGHEAEHAANVISQSMYSQCDLGGKNYVLFDLITDYWRGKSALTHATQKVNRVDGRT